MPLSIAIRFIHPGGASITGEDLGVQLRSVGIVVFEGTPTTWPARPCTTSSRT
jgi:hypothetical protein